MKNSKVSQFSLKVNEIVNDQKNSILESVKNYLTDFESINFEKFTNETPYTSDFKNKIFFTYSNHYNGNSGVNMRVANLHNPHLSYEDRGYIKGVVTDLDGYIKIRSANCIEHNLLNVANIYFPVFKNSKNKDVYKTECDSILKTAIFELNQFIMEQKNILNSKLKEITGCSLLFYIKDI